MRNQKVYKVIASRLAVATLNNNLPNNLEEEGLSEEDAKHVLSEFEEIIKRLKDSTVKQGGEFNEYCPFELKI